MKKIIYSLGLSVLLACPAWAQENIEAKAAPEPSSMSEEDAQTIFFSEDFLNDLASDNEEVLIFNDIPLDKTSDVAKDKASVQNTPQDVPAQTATTDAKVSEKAEVQQPLQVTPPNEPTTPTVVEPKAPLQETNNKLQAQVQNSEQPKFMEETSVAIKDETSAPATESSANIPENKVEEVAEPPVLQDPKVAPKQKTSEEPDLAKSIKKNDTVVNTITEEKNVVRESSQEKIVEIPPSEKNKPTIQEVIQDKIAPAPIEMPIAPSKPETNAFSLDDKAPLPKNMLQEDGFSTNMLNRGIRISPEQRARMMMKKKFTEMDLNQDGIITKAEFIRFKTAEAQKIAIQVYQQIDTNADNILSEKEYDVLMDKMIDNYIKNPQK